MLSALFVGLLASRSTPATTLQTPFPDVSVVDFIDSYHVTDQNQFLITPTGHPQPAGSGYYPDEEHDVHNAIPLVPYVVLQRGGTKAVLATFHNPSNTTISGTWNCDYCTIVDYIVYHTYNLSLAVGDNTISIPPGGEVTKGVLLSGMPDFVLEGSIDIAFSVNGTGWGGYAGKVYLVEGAPTGHMDPAWAEVLNSACAFAMGESGTVPCAKACTRGLFDSGFFRYDLDQEFIPTLWFEFGPGNEKKFKLTQFVNREGQVDGNCVDVSTFNSICMNALGISTTLNEQLSLTRSGFDTFDVCPIGDDRLYGSYGSLLFTMHQQAFVGGKVYDAALAFQNDLGGNTFKDTPADWTLGPPGYWQTPSGPSPVPLYGLAKRVHGHSVSSELVSFTTYPFTYQGVK